MKPPIPKRCKNEKPVLIRTPRSSRSNLNSETDLTAMDVKRELDPNYLDRFWNRRNAVVSVPTVKTEEFDRAANELEKKLQNNIEKSKMGLGPNAMWDVLILLQIWENFYLLFLWLFQHSILKEKQRYPIFLKNFSKNLEILQKFSKWFYQKIFSEILHKDFHFFSFFYIFWIKNIIFFTEIAWNFFFSFKNHNFFEKNLKWFFWTQKFHKIRQIENKFDKLFFSSWNLIISITRPHHNNIDHKKNFLSVRHFSAHRVIYLCGSLERKNFWKSVKWKFRKIF